MAAFEVHGEILAYRQSSKELLDLSPAERIFAYYMFRASLPFNHMYRDQVHHQTNNVIDHMTQLLESESDTVRKDIETYLAYLWANHGFYFQSEYSNNKRTPAKIGLTSLTSETLKQTDLIPYIFDSNVDPEMTVSDNIEKSGNNYYARGFTEEMYAHLTSGVKSAINAYPTLSGVQLRCISGKNKDELKVVLHWLTLALELVERSDCFDEHFAPAIKYLIQYFVSGDENLFKKHCIEWIQTNSRIDWTMGFIETYDDPKKIRGHAGAEVTVKSIDMAKLNPILLGLEKYIPIPDEYRRDPNSTSKINVSLNHQLYGSGDYGALDWKAAYCLPNYDEIRSKHGSKQIIYKTGKSAGELLNPELYKSMKPAVYRDLPYDTNELFEVLWDVQVILHETTGHGSGRFDRHSSGVEITDANYNTFITKDTDALEELRAEIIALYLSVFQTDTLNELGLFKGWYEKLGKEKLQEWCVIEMTKHALRRYARQKENFTEIVGAHAKANVTITNYLLNGGAIQVIEDPLMISVINMDKSKECITSLLQEVQFIKSTGNGERANKLFSEYLTSPITIEQANRYRKQQEEKRKLLIGDIKATGKIYSRLVPIIKNGELVDISVVDDEGFVAQNLRYDRLSHSLQLE